MKYNTFSPSGALTHGLATIVVVVNCMVMNCSRAAVTWQCKHIGDCADGAAYRPCVLRRPVFTQHVAASQSVHSLAVRSARRDADQHRR